MQHRGIPRVLPDTYNSQDRRRTDKRSPDRPILIDQWKWSIHGIEIHRRPARTLCADNDSRGIHGTYRLRVCTTAQPMWLPTNNGDCPRVSARNKRFWKNQAPSRRYTDVDRSPQKKIVTVVQTVFDRFWTDFRACCVTTSTYLLRGNIQNLPRGKYGKNMEP